MLFIVVIVLINVAFITLLERKVLGYSQLRLGPNKPSFFGIAQPLADAIKLFRNKTIFPSLINKVFRFMPFFSLWLILILWGVFPLIYFHFSFSYRFITLLAIFSISVYPVLFAGWGSNRKYSELGSLRNIAQTISYEVRMAIALSILIIRLKRLRLSELTSTQLCLLLWPIIIILWLIIAIAETNRTPFDFSEGERELVSGFNTEYSRNKFAAVFMAEYASIYFLRSLSVVFFIGWTGALGAILVVGLIFFWIWVRATLPRHRYDYLIILNWKSLLPLALCMLWVIRIAYSLYNKI